MRLLTNPLVLRMGIVFFAAAMAFILGLFAIRQLRKSVQEDAQVGNSTPSTETFPLYTYHAVIQQLKQQKHELQSLQQAERRRAKASENISAVVLANLSSGVLFFDTGGLVRQTNAAAKEILGFASPGGMSANELFRDAAVRGGLNSEKTPLSQAVVTSLKNLSKFERLEADYVTPSGQDRVLEVTVSPVHGAAAEILGATCLISDRTELARMRQNQAQRGEIPAEKADAISSTLASITEKANTLRACGSDQRDQVISEIVAEAQHLQRALATTQTADFAAGTASGLD